ncbi:MAG: NrfD/PsrC family molybdoenzyme membrane anchor subunit [Halanaeroarchaeum sp.]
MENIGLLWLERPHWGLTTALYLFFATLGGGAYLAGLAAYGTGSDEREIRMEFARWAFLSAFVGVAVAGIAIISHLARPLAGLMFPLTLTNFESWITRGTWILVSLGVFTALQTLWFHFGTLGSDAQGASTVVRRIASVVRLQGILDRLSSLLYPGNTAFWAVALLGALPAVGTVYTGFELAIVETVPLWNVPTLLPAVFLASGLAAGIAAPLALTVTFEGATSRFVAVSSGAVGVTLLATAVLLWTYWGAIASTPAAAKSVETLTAGSLQVSFAIVVIGMAVALVGVPTLAWLGYARGESSVAGRIARPGLVTTLFLAVLSSFFLRYALLFAAVKEPLVVVGL